VQIKIAKLDDISKIAPLFDAYRQFYEQPSNLAKATEFLQARLKNTESIIWFAEDNSQEILGFCQVYPSFCSVLAEPIYVLYDLFTTEKSRKSGVGSALLETAHQDAKTKGIARLDLTTAKDNLTAQSVYESLGWIRDDIFYAYNKIV
jgi:ribosomal protein S18 acetylase RimI-like enzyme